MTLLACPVPTEARQSYFPSEDANPVELFVNTTKLTGKTIFTFIRNTLRDIVPDEPFIPYGKASEYYDISNSIIFQNENKIGILEDLYIFRSPEEIRSFLKKNPHLINFLFQTYKKVYDIFSVDQISSLTLELTKDPEEDFEELFLVIKTALPLEISLDYIDKLDYEWFLNIDSRINKIFNITVESI